jgi:iron complex outermembrane receptor protein
MALLRVILVVLMVLATVASPFVAQDAKRLLEEYGTVVTVYGDRLPMEERLILDTAASVSVVTREEIQASGAVTLQEVLVRLPGVFLHDQTGNPTESTVDVRGFPQGTSLAVFLDGVRLNDLQDNSVRWDTIPLEDVERIEVYRGAAGPLYGGGALAGVVNVITRRNPGIPRVDVKAGAGSFASREGRAHASGSLGPLEFYATAMKRKSDGWRENDGFDLDDGLLRLSWELPAHQRLSFLAKYAGGRENQPGSLTAEEMRQNPRQSPYNLPDHTRGRQRLASLVYSASGDAWAFSGQGFYRLQDRDTLTTGRSGYGFSTSGTERLGGATAQASWKGGAQERTWAVSGGLEASSGAFEGRGFYTDASGGSRTPASSSGVKERFAGAYAQADLGLGPVHFLAGGRADRADYDYTDHFHSSNGEDRTFRESTWRAGLLWHTGEWSSAFLTYSQGYRIPSVVDLFAYPGFYSNPDLAPTRVGDWEAGWRYLRDGWRVKVTVFDMRVRDEVVFVLTDPGLFIGQNQNAGRSYRRGIEAEAHVPLPAGFGVFASGSYQDSEITAGPYEGSRVPMVPRAQGTVGVAWSDPSWNVRLAVNTVGSQRLDNDLLNTRPELPGYATVDLSARYAWRALTVEAAVYNLLDHAYASRGITSGFSDYFTPAYPRTLRLWVTYSF